jgi:hypothetical protein
MQGCTQTQDDVARLMSRLRLINGVQRVTLASSVKQDGGQSGAAVSAPSSGAGAGASAGCGANAPAYDLVIFFTPLPGGSATTTVPGTAPSPAAAAQATPSTPVGATPAPSTAPATQPVSTTAPSGGSK